MKRGSTVVLGLALTGLVATALVPAGGAAASPKVSPVASSSGEAMHRVYDATVDLRQAGLLREVGLDREDVHVLGAGEGKAARKSRVELVLTDRQARELRAKGLVLTERKPTGRQGRQSQGETEDGARNRAQGVRPLAGDGVFRPYSGPGGLAEELAEIAEGHPTLTKLVPIGQTSHGTPILAIKVTKDALKIKDGRRPAVLYISAQHAREWITPEMTRRLLRHVLSQYPRDPAIKKLVDTQELWFVPVANPDGYDFSFTTDREWRKNTRDNDGNGVIEVGDGVDLNRNFATKWGYDNEGSSPVPFSDTYRGPAPSSEPETRAVDQLMSRIGFRFMMNYHSAAELLLYGAGWQVATPSPNDVIYEAMAGDDANSAIPGYDPDLAAELYTTNGEIDGHAENAHGTLSFTAEMATCQTASAADPDDAFEPGDCGSVFTFPDSEPLIRAEFEKNLPFALAVAGSVQTPDRPVSVVGRTTPDFVPDTFTASYGDPQTVATIARNSLQHKKAYWTVNGGGEHSAPLQRWRGGERYGDERNPYYAEYRATVRGAKPGDRVKVWFGADRPKSGPGRPEHVTSEPFTYTVKLNRKLDVLVVSDEDYKGTDPTYPPDTAAPLYADQYVAALQAAGLRAAVWDTTAQGVPHHLGVLGHARAVIWYSGRNRLTQDPEDELTSIFGNDYPDASVSERAQYLTIALRDYLNEGGKLAVTGETMGYAGFLGQTLGGIYYGLGSDPTQDCVVTDDLFGDCQLLADDFFQYYLGAFSRSSVAGPTGFTGTDTPLDGVDVTFGGPGLAANPLDEAGTFIPTSSILPVEEFPQFRSWGSGTYRFGGSGGSGGSSGGGGGGADPFAPSEGSWYVGQPHVDDTYARLTRTVDLSSVVAAQQPRLTFDLSYDTEPGYDNVLIEARTVGSDDWTALPDLNGLSDNTVPDECEVGFLIEEHPHLAHYLTLDPAGCSASGTTGQWYRFTGNSGGWRNVAVDLAAWAGRQVEISISYVTDGASGGVGVFVDRTAFTLNGAAGDSEGFESGLGPWTVPGAPEGSPGNVIDFTRAQHLLAASVSTPDTVLLGFGLEQVDGAAAVKQAVASVKGLLGRK